MVGGTTSTLSSKLFPQEMANIQADVTKLLARGFLDSSKMSYYCHGFPSPLYLYHHTDHKSFSQTTFTMVASCADNVVEEIISKLEICDNDHHD